jgi:hypothetical protein
MARVHGAEMKRRSSHELSGLGRVPPAGKRLVRPAGKRFSRIKIQSKVLLAGLTFDARLIISTDRTGRTFNAISTILGDGAS